MKAIRTRRLVQAATAALAVCFTGAMLPQSLQAGNTWDGGGGNANWSTGDNWDPDGAFGYGTLTFSGSTQTTNVVDANTSMNMLLWTGSSTWTLNNSGGAVISLYDNGGAQAKIENQSSGLVTINAPINFAATSGAAFGEINAVNGDILFDTGGTLTVSGSVVNGLKFWGGSGRTVTFNNTLSATGKWLATTGAGAITIGATGSVTAADIFVMNGGSLNLAGTLTSDATKGIRLGGDFGTTGDQDLSKSGTLNLTPSAGGVSYAGIINSVGSNTSGALAVNSQNTSGTNTLSGAIILDSNLAISQAAGGTLALTTGGIDLKALTLTLTSGAGSNINASGVIANSAGSGSLSKGGAGTLTLSGNNTFGGGIGINEGTVIVGHDSGLGSGIVYLGNGGPSFANTDATLLLNASGLTVSNQIVTNKADTGGGLGTGLRTLGGNFTTGSSTFSGTINLDGGAVLTAGAGGTVNFTGVIANGIDTGFVSRAITVNASGGTVALSNTNTYTGGTTLTAGTLSFANGSLGTTGAITMNGGTLQWATGNTQDLSARLTMVNAKSATFDTNGNNVTLGTAFGGATSGSLVKSGSGTLSLTGTNTYTGGSSINAGTLSFANGSLGTTGAITMNGGTLQWATGNTENISARLTMVNATAATFDTNGNNVILGTAFGGATSGSLVKSGAGILTLSGVNTYTGKSTINGGTLSIAADTGLGTAPGSAVADQLTLNGGTLKVTANSQTLHANRGVTLGASGGTFDFSGRGTGESFTVGGVITGSGPLTLASSGDMSAGGGGASGAGIKLNQATNTYIGDTTITSGLVTYTNNLSFGDAANKIILNGGGLLDQNTNVALSREIQVLAGGGTFRGWGSINVTWTSAITGSGTINRTDGGTLVLSGDLSGYSGAFNVQGGRVTLTGTGLATGNWTTSSGGILRIGNGGATGDFNTGTLTNNATLEFGRISDASTFTTSKVIGGTGTIAMVSGNVTLTGAVSAGTLNFRGGYGKTLTLSGSDANTITNFTSNQDGHGTLILAKDAGVNALSGTVYVGNGYASQVRVYLGNNEQIANTSSVSMGGSGGGHGGRAWFDLMGYTETIAGLTDGTSQSYVRNMHASTASVLTLAGTGTYTLGGGYIQNGGVGTLGIAKTGSGTQTFVGGGMYYTGATTLSAGTLILRDTTAFASAVTLSATGILNSERTALGFASRDNLLGDNVSGTGILNINNSGTGVAGGWTTVTVANGLTMAGTINVNTGVLTRDNTTANNINTTATVNVAANGVLGTRGGGIVIGALNGAGHVSPLWGSANATTLTVGNGDGTGSFSGVIHGNGTVATDGDMEGGTLALIKMGTGTQTLSGVNTYTGATTLTAGILSVGTIGNGGVVSNLGAASTAAANLVFNGGTLQYTGATNSTNRNFTINATKIATFDITNAASNLVITGASTSTNGALVKTGAGILTLAGTNLYTGGTSVTGGTLVGTNTSALGVGGGLTLNGGNFAYNPTAAGALNLGAGVLNIASGSRIGTALGGTASQSAITSSSAAVTVAGTVTVDIYGIPGVAPTSGSNNLISAASGLNNATYTLGKIYNASNFTVSGFTSSATAVSVTATAVTALTAEYWKGGFSGSPGVWAITDGSTTSNWASDEAGTATSLTPGVGAIAIFSATGATNQSSMTLGASMSLAGMVVNDTNALTLNGDSNMLTLGTSGITVNSGAGAITLGSLVNLGTAQTWTNNSVNDLAVTGIMSGTANLTKAGTGTLTLGGFNTHTGITTVNTGTLALGNVNALSASTLDTGFTGSQAVTFTVGGNNTYNLGGLQGYDALAIGANTLSIGATNLSSTYFGVLSGTGGNLTKVGTGTLVLGGTATNSYIGLTTLTTGVLGLSKTSGYAITGDFTGSNIASPDVYTTANNQFAPGSVMRFIGTSGDHVRFELLGTTQTLAGIDNSASSGRGVIQQREQVVPASVGAISTLILNGTGTYSFDGYLRDTGGRLAVVKEGTGTQTLAGGNVRGYTGGTIINQGTLMLGTGGGNSTVWGTVTVNAGGTLNASVANTFGYNGGGLGTLIINGGTVGGGDFNNHFYRDGSSGTFNIYMIGGILKLGGAAGGGNGNQFRSAPIIVSSASTTTAQILSVTANANMAIRDGTTQIFNVGDGSQALDLLMDVQITENGAGGAVLKTGAGTMSMTRTGSYAGATTVSAGTLTLDYTNATYNTTRLSNTAALVLGGGTLELKGGSHTEIVSATTLTAGTASTVTRSSGTGVLQMNAITAGAGATVNFTAANIATTDTLNNASGILGGWATLGDTWAINSTGAADGLITAYAGGFTDVNRLGGTIANGAATNVRIIEAGASGNVTMAAAGTTNISTLLQGANGGLATVDIGAGNILRLGTSGGILLPTANSALTFSNGTLTAGGAADTAGGVIITNNSASNAVTINSVVANNGTGAISLTKTGIGSMTLAGVNTYTGGTILDGGTVTMSGSGTLGNTNNTLTLDSGTLDLNGTTQGVGSFNGAGGILTNTGAAVTFTLGNNNTSGEFSGVISGAVALSKIGTGTITLSGGTSNTFTGLTTLGGTGNIILNKTGGAVAISGDINMSASGTRATLAAMQDNQFGSTSVMRFTVTPGDTRFELKGTTQTLAGIDSTGFAGTYAAIQHSEVAPGTALTGVSTLILNVTGSNTYTFGNAAGTAVIRDQGGLVSLIKNGTGTQVLTGAGITYTGGTIINQGTIDLKNVANLNGPMIINAGGTLTTSLASTQSELDGLVTLNGGSITASVAGNSSYGNFLLRNNVVVGGTQKSVISCDFRLGDNATRNFEVNATGDVSGIDLDVTGKFSHFEGVNWGYMTKSGLGVMRFSNAAATNRVGSITVNAGKVILANVIGDNGDNGGLTANAAGTIDFNPGSNQTFDNVIHGAGVFNKEGAFTLTMTGDHDNSGIFNINGGTLELRTPSLITYSGSQINVNGATTLLVSTGGGSNRYDFATTNFNFNATGGGTITTGAALNWVAGGTWTFSTNGGAKNTVGGAAGMNLNANSVVLNVATGTNGTSDLDINIGMGNSTGGLTKLGTGIATLGADNTYTGVTTISGGTLRLGNGTTNGSVAGSIVNTANLTVNTIGTQTLANAISGVGGTFTKTGTGTLTLTGAKTYTGATNVNQGTLNVTGSLTSAVTVASGAILAGEGGTTTGALTLNAGSYITAVTQTAGAGNAFRSSGAVTAASLANIKINDFAPTVGTFNFDVLGYGTSAPNTANFNIGVFHAGSATVADDVANSKITLAITNANRTWNSASSTWDAMVTNAWQEGDFKYGQGDLVTFNDTGTGGGGARAVTLNSVVTPGNVAFNNSTSTYTVSGTGSIDGITALTKAGTGTVNLNTSNTYSGGTTVTAGTLKAQIGTTAGAKTNFGSGLVTVSNATLHMAAGSTSNAMSLANDLALNTATLNSEDAVITYSGGIDMTGTNSVNVYYANKNAIFSNTVSGSGGITKTGAGSLILTGANTYAGTTTISAGTVQVGNAGTTGTFGSGAVVNNSTLLFKRTDSHTVINNITGTGTLYPQNGGTVTFAGSGTNSFKLDLYNSGGSTAVLGMTAGSNAVTGTDIRVGSGLYGTAGTLRLASSEQIADTTTVTLYTSHHSATGTFSLMGNNETIGGLISGMGGGAGSPGQGILQNGAAANSTITLNVGPTLTRAFGYSTSKAVIRDGSTGVLNLIKTGTGTQVLGAATLSYTGTTSVNQGTLSIRGSNFNTSATTVAGGTLDIQGSTFNAALSGTTGSLTITGGTNSNFGGVGNKTYTLDTVISGASTTLTQTAFNSLSAASIHNIGTGATLSTGNLVGSVKAITGAGGVNLAGTSANLIIADGSSQTFSGVITGTGKLTKAGSGTQSLSGGNNYTGSTNVLGGTLQLDFATGGTSNILATGSALVLGGGTLEILGGASETNTQTVNGVSGTGKLLLTQNSATSINATLGAITGSGVINFTGANTTVSGGVATAGTGNYITSTTAGSNDGAARFGMHLWNGSDWASTATDGASTTYVVQWQGTYSDIYNGTTPGPVAIPTGTPAADVRILEATGGFGNNTLGASETINSLLMSAGTTAATVSMGTFTLTVGNGAGATGAVAIADIAKSLFIGTVAEEGFLTAGTTSAASILGLNNASATSTLTVNSVVANNAAGGVVSLVSNGAVTLNGTNTYTGSTTLAGGVLSVATIGNGGVASNLGASAVAASNLVFDGGTLGYTGITASSNRGFTINADRTATIDVTQSGANLTVSGGTTATNGSLTKKGAGTLTLSGTGITYTGVTRVNEGRLVIKDSGTAYDSFSTTIASGAVLEFNTSLVGNTQQLNNNGQIITGTGTLEKTGPGNLYFGANGQTIYISLGSGALIDVKDGILRNEYGAGNWTANLADMNIGATAKVDLWDANITVDALTGVAGSIVNEGLSAGTNRTLTVGVDNGSGSFGGTLTNTSGTLNLTKTGTGTQTLTGNNTYSGFTAIGSGALNIRHANALGNTTGTTTVTGGAALEIQGGITTAAEALTLNGTGVSNGGALRNVLDNNTYAGLVTLGSTGVRINSDSGLLTLSHTGTITGAGYNLTVGGAGNTTVNSIIGTGSGSLTKDGGGTLTLAGANTYTGATTVNAGALVINGNQSAATGAVTINNTGTRLLGTGTIGGATTINAGAIHSAGSAIGAVGNQTFSSSLTYADGSVFEWDIDANSVASGFDTVAVTGSLNGTTGGDTSVFRVVFGTTAKAGIEDSGNAFWNTPYGTQVWSMTSLFGQNFTSGMFTSVETFDADGAFDVSAMGTFTITDTSLTWAAVPEPSSAMAGLLIGAGLLRRRRRA